MAKSIDEINELLATDLFKQGIAKGYIKINKVNDDNTKIDYICKNNCSKKLQNPEEFVQASTFLKLIINKNYLPKNITVNESVQMGADNRQADILVYDLDNHKIIIVVECKEENINERQFQIAVDQAYSYAHSKAAQYIWITSGVKNEYYEIVSAAPLKRIAISSIPERGGSVEKCQYIKGVKDKEPQVVLQNELIQKFKSAHDALWGGGALAPTTAFDELDKLIFCKIWDEKWEEYNPKSKGEPYEFQIINYEEDKNDIQNTKAKTELENRVRRLYEEGRKKDPEVFKDDIKLDKHKIYVVVQYLQDINLSKTNLDAKGAAFQNFMGDFFRGDFGQFFTPDPITTFITDAIPIEKRFKVLDTSCGSGGFLLHALKKVREEADKLFPDGGTKWYNYWHDFAKENLFGIEINEQISRVAKMNMIIHDDGHTNVITNDGLKLNKTIEQENRNLNFQDGTFDLIMTNPPFGSSIKADEVAYFKNYELFERNIGYTELKERIADNDNKNKWRVAQSTEILFLERCYKYLCEGGFLAIVVPDGIITNSTNQYVRDWLIDKFRIVAVASLPQYTFSHVRAGVKSSVLFLKKYPENQVKKFEEILNDTKTRVREMKELHKEMKSEKIIELYKERIFKIIDNYNVLMLEIENIGYDAVGKPKGESELFEASKRINDFILKENLV